MTAPFTLIDDNPLFIVVNKAPNINFHTEQDVLGIVELVKAQLNYQQLYPVHRLDKMTSGLLIFAKTASVAAQFGVLFSERLIEKYYLALSDKKPKKKQGLIKGDMSKGRNGSYLLLKTKQNPAVTQFFSFSVGHGQRIFVLKPHTGKTHQLRVAMKSLGAPINGDPRYYPNNQQTIGQLHAWCLRFTLAGKDYHYQTSPSWVLDNLSIEAWCDGNQPWSLDWPTL
ncbi:MAG: TIGR01621 family pseudouridine synthase [Gammaproteobacteria bacterium]|nr:TIGR01621 family pseudouridine synthase [Gammaproteobacteria bacterium]